MTTSAPSLSLRWLESFTIWINIKIELSKDIFQFLQTNDHVHSRDHYHLDLVFWKPPGVRSGRRSCASSVPQTRCTPSIQCSSQTPWWPIQIISLAEVSVKCTIFSVSFLTLYSWLWKRQDDQELCETVNTNWKKGPVSLSESHAHMELPLPERPQGSHLQGNQNHDLPRQEGFTLAKRQSAISSQSPLAFQLLEYQWGWRKGKFDKLTPSSLPPYSMFMTEVTSMIWGDYSDHM